MTISISAEVERDIKRFAGAKAVSEDQFLREVLEMFLSQSLRGTSPRQASASAAPAHAPTTASLRGIQSEVAIMIGKRYRLPVGLKVRIHDQKGKSFLGESLEGGRIRFDGSKEIFRSIEAARKEFRGGSENVWYVAEYYSESHGRWRRIDALRLALS